jgi:hypothetical protein
VQGAEAITNSRSDMHQTGSPGQRLKPASLLQNEALGDIGVGSERHFRDVREESGLPPTPDLSRRRSEPPLRANCRLVHRSKRRPYSICSLAINKRLNGTSMPSARTVFRLMARTYFVGVCTGRSPALVPLRMRST